MNYTDEQIITALKQCGTGCEDVGTRCSQCPLGSNEDCSDALSDLALDLIKRQQIDIAFLRNCLSVTEDAHAATTESLRLACESARSDGMAANEYQRLAGRTSNPEHDARTRLTNGALGMCGESGEVADIVKKHLMQGHMLDTEHVARELGDVLWYVAEAASAIGYDLSAIMRMNIDKLRARYPDGFDVARSVNRKEGDI